MTGEHAHPSADPIPLASLSDWNELKEREIDRCQFWWGWDGKNLHWTTLGFRSYLSLSEPRFRVFRENEKGKSDPANWFFGIHDKNSRGLVIARNGHLVTYGNIKAKEILMESLHRWVDHGMPSRASMNLRIYPIDSELEEGPRQWIVRKKESLFLWSMKGNDNGTEEGEGDTA